MPTHKAAEKSIRQQTLRHERNVAHKSRLRTAIKKVVQLTEANDMPAAKEALNQAIPIIDKTCSKGVIHKNKAARHKSRLTLNVNALAATAEKPTAEKPKKTK